MLVHICCSVDNFYYMSQLQKHYPDEKLIGYFYDPNIHPYEEYYLRLLDAKRSCHLLNVTFIEGDYDYENWLETVKGLENEPEKGNRCSICFDERLKKSFAKAKELGETSLTTTLFMSPLKNLEQIRFEGEKEAQKYGIKFIVEDFRKGNGQQAMRTMAKEFKAYHQDYCGCYFALSQQRLSQERPLWELYEPITGQIQLGSIRERISLYEKRLAYETKNKPYTIIKSSIKNWRLEWGKVIINNLVIPSYIIAYSTLAKGHIKGTLHECNNGFFSANKEECYILTREFFNTFCGYSFSSLNSLSLSFNDEIAFRTMITGSPYSRNTLIIVENITNEDKYEILLQTRLFDQKIEHLLT